MAENRIRFYFDFISPYAYLAWTQIQELAKRQQAILEPIPILFAALLDQHGQKGPAEIPPKRLYMYKDVIRRALRLGVPLVPPPTHPFNPLLALRVASIPAPVDQRLRLIDALFKAAWASGTGIESRDSVAAVLGTMQLNAAPLLEAAASPDVKARLKQQTDEALTAGVFGVPTMIVKDELFWGSDSLEALEAFMKGEDPLQGIGAETLERWQSIVPSASRR